MSHIHLVFTGKSPILKSAGRKSIPLREHCLLFYWRNCWSQHIWIQSSRACRPCHGNAKKLLWRYVTLTSVCSHCESTWWVEYQRERKYLLMQYSFRKKCIIEYGNKKKIVSQPENSSFETRLHFIPVVWLEGKIYWQ